jgi:hypothetical protein
VLGVLLGLAALTRGRGAPARRPARRALFWREWRKVALALAAFAVVLAPWTVRNLVTFERPVLISTTPTASGRAPTATTSSTATSSAPGDFSATRRSGRGRTSRSTSPASATQGLDYLRERPGRLPAVMVARGLRLVDLWNVDQALFLNAAEGSPVDQVRWGIRMAWALMLLGAAGVVVLLRRRERGALLVLLAPVAMVIAVSLATYGTTRFRFAAEPSLCVLAAVALVAVLRTRITQFQVMSSRSPGTRVMNASRGQ